VGEKSRWGKETKPKINKNKNSQEINKEIKNADNVITKTGVFQTCELV
jgi:hypothetical protein